MTTLQIVTSPITATQFLRCLMRVLVVDDDRSNCLVQVRLLEIAGYEAFCCHDGADAMEVIERLRPDVILLDLCMPQMDGFAVVEELNHNFDMRPKCLIAVTGLTTEEAKHKASELGFDYYLLKPVEWSRLSSILQHVALGRRDSESERRPVVRVS